MCVLVFVGVICVVIFGMFCCRWVLLFFWLICSGVMKVCCWLISIRCLVVMFCWKIILVCGVNWFVLVWMMRFVSVWLGWLCVWKVGWFWVVVVIRFVCVVVVSVIVIVVFVWWFWFFE